MRKWVVSATWMGMALSACSAGDGSTTPVSSASTAPLANGSPVDTVEIAPSDAVSSSATVEGEPGADEPAHGDAATRCDPMLPSRWTTVVAGVERLAHVYPADTTGPAPVLVLFHGFGGSASAITEQSGLVDIARAAGVHLVVPEGSGDPSTWNIGDAADTAFVDELLVELAANPCVDGSRIGLAGFSAGAAWSGVYGCTHTDQIALVLMASGLPGNLCSPESDIEILIAHGTADPVVAFEGGDQLVGDSTVTLDPVPESALLWAEGAGCVTERDVRPIDDGVTTLTTWTGCGGGTHVLFEVVEGMAHTWAGTGIDGGRLNPGCIAVHRLARSADAVGACL